jgi:hypothetical protein
MRARRLIHGVTVLTALLTSPVSSTPTYAGAAAEVKLDRDFIASLVEKLPPVPFQKEGQYHGSARAFRLLAIDPKTRRFLVACEVAGEFRPPIAQALRLPTAKASGKPGETDTPGWRAFTFDVKAGVRVEPGQEGSPRFQVDVEEVKRRELEGIAGALARVLGRSFDDLVTQVAAGKAALLSDKANARLQSKLAAFQQYGVFCGIDYFPDHIALTFDVTRLKSEGIVGYVFAEPTPGAVPLYRFVRPRPGDHYYSTDPEPNGLPGYVYEKVACYVLDQPRPGSVPLLRWRSRRECFYTQGVESASLAPSLGRVGYRPEAVACHLYGQPSPGTVPLYQFVDPRTGLHFYSTHPHAEFMK